MSSEKGNEKQQWIETIKNRLKWYTLEASEEEFDPEEVDMLVELLQKLEPREPLLIDEQVTERFQAYCRMREEDEKVLEEARAAEKAARNQGKLTKNGEKKRKKWGWHLPSRRIVAAAAVLAVVLLAVGGSLGSSNAEKNGGFFRWLRKDETGATVILSPTDLEEENIYGKFEVYENREEVPEEFQPYLIDLDQFSLLKQYELDYIECCEGGKVNCVRENFLSPVEEWVELEVRIYQPEVLLYRETYDGYIFQDEYTKGGVIYDVFLKEDQKEEQWYAVQFLEGNRRYMVQGKDNLDFLKDLAEEYHRVIAKK